MAIKNIFSGDRSTFAPIWIALATGSAVMLCGQFMKYFATNSGTGLSGGLALLLPWLLLLVASVLIAVLDGPVRLALVGGSGTVAMALAAPFVVDRLQGVGVLEAVWTTTPSTEFRNRVEAIANGDVLALAVGRWVTVLGMLLLFAFAVIALLRLRPLLLGPAARSGFGIDITLLLVIFAGVSMAVGRSGVPGSWLEGLSNAASLDIPVALDVRMLSWVLPLVVWLALTCRQGGALAVGATAGAVVTFLVLPSVINTLGNAIGGKAPYINDYDPVTISPYEALDWSSTKPALALLSVVLLLIALWWALGVQSSGTRPQVVVSSGSKANSLSIVAFTLSWFPLTAIPAIVLGHMAYDQLADSREPQRGIGLARWSIILGYLSLIGAAAAANTIWG